MADQQSQKPDGEIPSDLELRFNLDNELRADNDTARRVVGYAALFNVKAKIRSYYGTFEEWLNPGCFTKSLGSGVDVRFLVEHDSSALLARTSAGTLVLQEDAKGLRFESPLPDTTCGRDTYEQIRVKNFTGMSFGFRSVKYRSEYDDNGRLVRVQHDEVELHEVTVTSMPAYPKTSVALRSLFQPPAAPAGDLSLRARVVRLRG